MSKEIKIPEGCTASIDFDKRVVVIEEEKEVLLVPESIHIYRYEDEPSLYISFNECKQLLGYNQRYEGYVVDVRDELYEKIQCKLTPCKREDLKEGDTAYFTDEKDTDFTTHYNYCKIVGTNNLVYINSNKNVVVNNQKWEYWYKVERINK